MDDEGTEDVTETGQDDADFVDGVDEYVDEEPVGEEQTEPDVLLDVPLLKVDEITLDVEDLRARVSLQAEVLDLLRLNVGADVQLGAVHLEIKGVEAQALLKVRLDNVVEVIGRVLTTIDRNPEILRDVTSSVGAAVREVGSGAGRTLDEVGRGAGRAVEDLGRGAGTAVEGVGRGAGAAVEGVGRGAGEAVGELGGETGRAVGGLAEQAGEVVEGAAGQVGEASADTEGSGRGVPEARTRKAGDAAGRVARKTARAQRAAEGGEGASRQAGEAPRRKVRRVRDQEAQDEGRPP